MWRKLCPNAWVINFTNPAGMVTEAVYRHTNFKKFIGVCNIPVGMKMFISDVLALNESDDLSIDLFGLNHMVFIKDVLVNGTSRFDELLDGVASGQLKASTVKNILRPAVQRRVDSFAEAAAVLVFAVLLQAKRDVGDRNG